METLIIHTEGEKLKTIQNLLKLLDIKFEKKKEKSPYNQEFVNKILNTKNEKTIVVNSKNVWELIDQN